MDKMRMESLDFTTQNIEKIGELFPNCITETVDENGKPKKAINFELLRQMLSEDVIDGDEAYEFTWVGKKAAIVEANKSIRKTLRPCMEESKDWDTTENLYIEGDNLEVLKLLQESYLGKVKMIYIDPPYNTGSDFVYPDSFIVDNDEFNEGTGYYDENGNINYSRTNSKIAGKYHSDWCSMMYSRLILARNLLTEDGVIFVSIDYNENFNLRSIMDEIFGSACFIGEIYWESKTKSQNTATAYNKLQPKAEMILVYSIQPKRRFNLIKLGMKEYPLEDEKGKYREYPQDYMNATGIRGRESMIFEISDGISKIMPPEGKQWQLGKEQIEQYQNNGDLFIRDNKVIIKMRPQYERNETTAPFWGFFDKGMGTAEGAKKELGELIPNHGFDTVKPIEIMKRLIYHATSENDIVLDFFSGSGTTAHALMQLYIEEKTNRKYILVQVKEELSENKQTYKTGFCNICELAKERIRRAGDKIKAENPDTTENLDIGFRVLKLDDSNMKDVYYSTDEYNQDFLDALESNIKEDRTDLDLLFGCLLEWGIPLSLPYSSEIIDGCMVHNYNDGDLIACFDEAIPDSVVKTIAKKQPLRAVFRDSGFVNSPSKINVGEIIKMISPDTRVKIL